MHFWKDENLFCLNINCFKYCSGHDLSNLNIHAFLVRSSFVTLLVSQLEFVSVTQTEGSGQKRHNACGFGLSAYHISDLRYQKCWNSELLNPDLLCIIEILYYYERLYYFQDQGIISYNTTSSC